MKSKLIAIGAFSLIATTNKAAEKPNIIFLLTDDAGYADFGFQGSKQFKTPNIDKLAASGVVLEQLYTTDAVSGPSRSGLLSGQYQQKFGIEENPVIGYMSKHGLHGLDMGFPTDIPFLSEQLKEAGYTCGVFGKWHLGGLDEHHPLNRGFDHFVGFRGGARSYFAYKYFDESTIDKRLEYGLGDYREPDRYLTDILADEACDFLDKNQDKPIFLYLAFSAPHTPLHATDEDLAMFPELSGNRKRLAAMTWSVDRACGKLFEKLKELNMDKNTIIVLSNDNGGPDGPDTSNYPLSGMKATFLEGGIRVPGIISYPGVIEANTRYSQPISFLDFFPTFTNLAGCQPATTKDLDGVDILPFITGTNTNRPHQTLFWKCENRGALRDGDMKFMRFPDRPAELYDLSKDVGEHNNLASSHPELVRKYYKMLFDWEMTLDRPQWMLERKYEKRVIKEYYDREDYRYPKEQL